MLTKKYAQLTHLIQNYLAKIAIFLFSMGIFFLLVLPTITHYSTKYLLTFKPGFESYDTWQLNKEPFYQDYYFFNWTNFAEFSLQPMLVKPVFEEVGPYRFKQYKEYRNVTQNDNETLTFYYTKTYHFVKEPETRDLSDTVFTINPLARIVAHKARYMGYFARLAVSMALASTSPLFVNKTVEEYLFKGYDDKLLNMLHSIPFIDKSKLPAKFGWEYNKNGTDHVVGPFNSHSTLDKDFGKIYSYQYKNISDKYSGKCSEFRGSLGDMNPMDMTQKEVTVYTTDLCAYLTLPYEKEERFKGIFGYRYATNKESFFDNGLINKDNQCFCDGECVPKGLLNISSCMDDAPVFASLPHFYDADPYYRNSVVGMRPEYKKHDLFVTLEPKTGKVIHIGVRLQINMLLDKVPGIRLFQNMPRLFIPILYVNQEIAVPDNVVFKLKLAQFPDRIKKIVGYPLLVAGMCLLGTICFISVASKRYVRERYEKATAHVNIEENKPLNCQNEEY